MNDTIVINLDDYARRLDHFFSVCRDADIQFMDDISQYPAITPCAYKRIAIPQYSRETLYQIVTAWCMESITAHMAQRPTQLASDKMVELLTRNINPNLLHPTPYVEAYVQYTWTVQDLVDWLYTCEAVDSIILDIQNISLKFFGGKNAYRQVNFFPYGNNLYVILGEDHRVIEYEEARLSEGSDWTKNIKALYRYLFAVFSHPQPISQTTMLPPLVPMISVEQLIAIGLNAHFPNIELKDRSTLNMQLSTIGQTVTSLGAILKNVLIPTDIQLDLNRKLKPEYNYTFTLSKDGYCTILRKEQTQSELERMIASTERFLDDGGYLPHAERLLYEAAKRRR